MCVWKVLHDGQLSMEVPDWPDQRWQMEVAALRQKINFWLTRDSTLMQYVPATVSQIRQEKGLAIYFYIVPKK